MKNQPNVTMGGGGGGGGRLGGLGTTRGGATWSCVVSCTKHSKDKKMWFSVRNALYSQDHDGFRVGGLWS